MRQKSMATRSKKAKNGSTTASSTATMARRGQCTRVMVGPPHQGGCAAQGGCVENALAAPASDSGGGLAEPARVSGVDRRESRTFTADITSLTLSSPHGLVKSAGRAETAFLARFAPA